MAQPKINLYVDVISPFGYLAFYMLQVSPTSPSVSWGVWAEAVSLGLIWIIDHLLPLVKSFRGHL